jgi:anti-sigma factor RsiW
MTHIDIDELSDHAEGLLPPDRAVEIVEHLSGCEECRSLAEELSQVTDLLAATPTPSMPDAVFAGLQETIAAEQRHRESARSRRPGTGAPVVGTGRPPYVDDAGHPSLKGGGRFPKPHIAEHFTETKPSRRGLRAKFAGGAVAATLLASTAGFGGYVLSASTGADEPPTNRPIVATDPHSLASSAASAAANDLDAYRFSKAWRCARKVTDGRISGIRSAVVEGQPGYLVFLESGASRHAVFVHGCDTDTPTAGPTVALPEK